MRKSHLRPSAYGGRAILSAALTLAALLARGLRAWAAADAGRRLLAAAGHPHDGPSPRLRPGLSPRVWAASFAATSLVYLVHADTESAVAGRWPLLAPWLHTSALPVFAVLSVVVAVVYRAVEQWLSEYETYAQEAALRASRCAAALPAPRTVLADLIAPRSLFGLAFEVRPPPFAV